MREYIIDTKSGVLSEVLGLFSGIFKNGGEVIAGAGLKIALALLILQWFKAITLMGMSRQHITSAALYIVGAICWYEAVTNIVPISDAYMSWMGSIGSQLSGSIGSAATMQNPSGIFATGLKATENVSTAMKELSFLDGDALLILSVWLFMSLQLFMFMVLGAFAVIVVVQAYVDVTVAVALMPFAIEPGTRFLATPGIGKILSAGVTLGTSSAIIGAGLGLLNTAAAAMPKDGEAALRYAVNMSCGSIVIALLAGMALLLSRAGVSKLTSSSSMVGR